MLSNIPTKPHFAIITETRVYIPGDERSRTHPGHGYPDHYETYCQYEAFDNRDAWVLRIQSLTARHVSFRAIDARPATVSTTTNVSVE